jgi:hypothetical protein
MRENFLDSVKAALAGRAPGIRARVRPPAGHTRAGIGRATYSWLITGLILIALSTLALVAIVDGQIEHRQTVANGVHADGIVVATDFDNRFPTVTVALSGGARAQLSDYPGQPKVGDTLRISYPHGHPEEAVSLDSAGDPLWLLAGMLALALAGIACGVISINVFRFRRAHQNN